MGMGNPLFKSNLPESLETINKIRNTREGEKYQSYRTDFPVDLKTLIAFNDIYLSKLKDSKF